MIERLLAAEGALARDELDHAQRLFGQVVEADPRNAMAVVGLARVLTRRGDTDAARELLNHALEIDPEEAAARRLLVELDTTATVGAQRSDEIPLRPSEPPVPVSTSATAVAPRPAPRGLLSWIRRLFRAG